MTELVFIGLLLYVVGNAFIYMFFAVLTVLRAAMEFTAFAYEGLGEMPPPDNLRRGYLGTELQDDYERYCKILSVWDTKRVTNILKLILNAPVLYYELNAGLHDFISLGNTEYGGVFSHDLKGLARTLHYGRFLMCRKTRIEKWTYKDKNNTGAKWYYAIMLLCCVYWAYIPLRIAWNKYAMVHTNTEYAKGVYKARKLVEDAEKLEDRITESRK